MEEREAEVAVAVTTMVGLFVGLLLSLFRYGTVLAIDTNTTDNNIVIHVVVE